jgi:hypothetical protein
MSWLGLALLGEVGRSLRTRPFSALVLCLVISGGAIAAAATDMTSWHDDVELSATQESLGSLVIRVTSGDNSATVSDRACISLNSSNGVRAAGGIGAGTLEYISTSPGLQFAVLPASGAIVQALTGQSGVPVNPTGLVVADEIAEQVGVRDGSRVVLDGMPTRVSEVAALGQRDPLLGRVALDVGPPLAELTACYVEFTDDYALQQLETTLSGTFASTPNLQLTRLFATGNGTPDPAELWSDRPTRDLYIPVGLLGALICLLVIRGRRHEYSIYLITGSTRSTVAFLILIYGYTVIAASTVISAIWLAALGRIWHVPDYGIQLGLLAAAHVLVVVSALLTLSLGWLPRADLHRLLRERSN